MDYTILEEDEGHVLVELDHRPTVDSLYIVGDEVREKVDQDYLTIDFCIPSLYPRYPKDPWAQIHFVAPGEYYDDEEHIILQIFGAVDDKEVRTLQAIQPEMEDYVGKWYHHHPMMEELVIIERYKNWIELRYYMTKDYTEIDGELDVLEDWSSVTGIREPDQTEQLTMISENEFETIDGQRWIINDAGELVASGVYLFVVSTEEGDSAVGKVAIVRE